jgi:hypothetical protein
MNVKILNIDSCYSTYQYDQNNTSGITKSPYYVSYSLSNPIRNIRRIALLSVEMPLLFNNIRSNTNNLYSLNYLSFDYKYLTINYTYTTTITESFYNNISSLLSSINATIASDATLTSRNIQVVLTVNASNKIVVTTNSTSFKFNNTPTDSLYPRTNYPFMNLILGFDDSVVTTGTLTAINRYNLNIDNYINMQVLNFGSNQNVNNIQCSFKIPVNAVNGTIYYSFSNITYDQYIDNTDNNLVLEKLNIRFVDRFNGNLNPNGGDWSASFAIIYKP